MKRQTTKIIGASLIRILKEMEKIINLEAIELSIEKELVSNRKSINECTRSI